MRKKKLQQLNALMPHPGVASIHKVCTELALRFDNMEEILAQLPCHGKAEGCHVVKSTNSDKSRATLPLKSIRDHKSSGGQHGDA